MDTQAFTYSGTIFFIETKGSKHDTIMLVVVSHTGKNNSGNNNSIKSYILCILHINHLS